MEKLLFVLIVFIWTISFRMIIISAIEGLCKKYKCRRVGKLKLDQPLIYRITRLHLFKVNIKRKYLLKVLVIFNNAYILVLISLIPWTFLFLFNIGSREELIKFIVIKLRVLDLPTFVFLIVFYRRRHKNAMLREWKL